MGICKQINMRWKLYITNFLLGAGLYSSVEVLYLKDCNLSPYTIALLVLFIPVCTAVLEIPTGIIGDYFGRITIFRLTFCSFLIGILLVSVAGNLPMFFLGYFFEALGYSFYSGNSESLLYESCKAEGTDINKAMSSFYSTLTAGYVFSGVLVFVLTNITRSPILKVAILGTIVLRFVAVLITMSTLKGKKNERTANPRKIIKDSLSLILNNRMVFLICLYDALGRLQYFLPVIYQPLLLKLGMRVEYIALIYSLSQLFQAVSQKVSVRLIKKYGYTKILLIAPIVQFTALAGLLTSNSVYMIIGIVVIFSGISIKGQCTSLIKHSIATDEIRATYLSIMSLLTLIINSAYLNGIGLINDSDTVVATVILGSVLLIGSELAVLGICSNIKKIGVTV